MGSDPVGVLVLSSTLIAEVILSLSVQSTDHSTTKFDFGSGYESISNKTPNRKNRKLPKWWSNKEKVMGSILLKTVRLLQCYF
jgi:hypothetical protein